MIFFQRYAFLILFSVSIIEPGENQNLVLAIKRFEASLKSLGSVLSGDSKLQKIESKAQEEISKSVELSERRGLNTFISEHKNIVEIIAKNEPVVESEQKDPSIQKWIAMLIDLRKENPSISEEEFTTIITDLADRLKASKPGEEGSVPLPPIGNPPPAPLSGPPSPAIGGLNKKPKLPTGLTDEEKNKSDGDTLTMFKGLGEPIAYKNFEDAVDSVVSGLVSASRIEKFGSDDQKKRFTSNLSELKNLLNQIKASGQSVEKALQNAYAALTVGKKLDAQRWLVGCIKPFLFDTTLADKADAELVDAASGIFINLVAAMRSEMPKVNEELISDDSQNKSDTQLIKTLKNSEIQSLADMLRMINVLRINPDYLKYAALEDDIKRAKPKGAIDVAQVQAVKEANAPDAKAQHANMLKDLLSKFKEKKEKAEIKAEGVVRDLERKGLMEAASDGSLRTKGYLEDAGNMERYLYKPLQMSAEDINEIIQRAKGLKVEDLEAKKAIAPFKTWERNQIWGHDYLSDILKQVADVGGYRKVSRVALAIRDALKSSEDYVLLPQTIGGFLLKLAIDGKKTYVRFPAMEQSILDGVKNIVANSTHLTIINAFKQFIRVTFVSFYGDDQKMTQEIDKCLSEISARAKNAENFFKSIKKSIISGTSPQELFLFITSGLFIKPIFEVNSDDVSTVLDSIYSLRSSPDLIKNAFVKIFDREWEFRDVSNKSNQLNEYNDYKKNLGKKLQKLFPNTFASLVILTDYFARQVLAPKANVGLLRIEWDKALKILNATGDFLLDRVEGLFPTDQRVGVRLSENLKDTLKDMFAIFEKDSESEGKISIYFDALYKKLITDFPLKEEDTERYSKRLYEFGDLLEKSSMAFANIFLKDFADTINSIATKKVTDNAFRSIPAIEIFRVGGGHTAEELGKKTAVYNCLKTILGDLNKALDSAMANVTPEALEKVVNLAKNVSEKMTLGEEKCKNLDGAYRTAAIDYLAKIERCAKNLIYQLPDDVKKAMEEAKSSKVATEKKK